MRLTQKMLRVMLALAGTVVVVQAQSDAAASDRAATAPSTDTSAPNPDETIEEVVYTGPLPQSCLSPDVKYESEVLTDFIPVYREARQCQQACQAHGECYFWTWNKGEAGALSNIPEQGEEIELFVPEYTYEEGQRRALAFADYQPAPRPARRMRSLQDKLPTADEILADPPAGACFLFGPYVKTSQKASFVSGPRTCADECSALYSANCKYSRCCARATATCVSKDSFFAQCRLPTDACPGRGWNCYNVSSTPLGCLEYDTEYAPDVFGNDLEEILDVPTELHCQELCKNHDKCNYWSYNPWYKHMCLLKKKSRPKRAAKGIISGTKECAGFSQPETLYYLEESPEYSTFYALLQKVGLVEYVAQKTAAAAEGTGGITLLIPTNRAFEALPTSIERQLKENDKLLKQLMLYHMIDKPVWIERTIGDKTFTAIKSASGDDIGLSRRASAGGALRINDADVLIMDLKTKDGMINLITEVLIPPTLSQGGASSGSLDDLDGNTGSTTVTTTMRPTTATTTSGRVTTPVVTTTARPTTAAAEDEDGVVSGQGVGSILDADDTTTTTTTAAPTTMRITTTTTTTTTPRPTTSEEKGSPSSSRGSVGSGSTTSSGLENQNAEDQSSNLPAVAENSVEREMDEGVEEIESDESNGVFGLGGAGIVVLLLIIALVLAAAGAVAFFLYRKRQARKHAAAAHGDPQLA